MRPWPISEPVRQVVVCPVKTKPDGLRLWRRDELGMLLQQVLPESWRYDRWKQVNMAMRVVALPCMYDEATCTLYLWDMDSSAWKEQKSCPNPMGREGTNLTFQGAPGDLYLSNFIWKDPPGHDVRALMKKVDFSHLTLKGAFLVQDDKGPVVTDIGLKLEAPSEQMELPEMDLSVMTVALVPTVLNLPEASKIPVVYLQEGEEGSDDDEGDIDVPMHPLDDTDSDVPSPAPNSPPGDEEQPEEPEERIISVRGLFD